LGKGDDQNIQFTDDRHESQVTTHQILKISTIWSPVWKLSKTCVFKRNEG